MPKENYKKTVEIMRILGVDLPPKEELNHNEVEPTFLVASKLMGEEDRIGVTASYIKPGIEADSNYSIREFDTKFPKEVMLLCKNIQTLGGRAVLAGGCIRDLIYGELINEEVDSKDYDIEVYGIDITTVEKLLTKIFPGIKVSFEGKSFGVLKLFYQGPNEEPLDISVAREDTSTGEAHTAVDAKTNPRMSFKQGSRRRDIRYNASLYDPIRKTLYDPFMGEIDLINKEINVVDKEAFIEDPLRVLRIMQFSARFETQPSDETKQLCIQMIKDGKLDTLSAEKKKVELIKLLTKSNKPSIGLEFAKEIGFIEKYWYELNDLIGVKQHKPYHPEGDVWKHTMQTIDAAALIAKREKLDKHQTLVLVLTLLCHDLGKPSKTEFVDGKYRAHGHEKAGVPPTEAFLKRLKISNKVKKEVLTLVPKHMRLHKLYILEKHPKEGKKSISADSALRRLTRKFWDQSQLKLQMLMLVAEADHKGRNGEEKRPFTAEELPAVVEIREWFHNKMSNLKIEEKPEERLLDNNVFLFQKKARGGPWLGVIGKCVLFDQEQSIITTPQEAIESANKYYDLMQQYIGQEQSITEDKSRSTWVQLLNQKDPREFLNTY